MIMLSWCYRTPTSRSTTLSRMTLQRVRIPILCYLFIYYRNFAFVRRRSYLLSEFSTCTAKERFEISKPQIHVRRQSQLTLCLSPFLVLKSDERVTAQMIFIGSLEDQAEQ